MSHQSIHLGTALGGEAVVVPKQLPVQTLKARIGLLLDSTHLVHGRGGVGNDMELVEGDAGIGEAPAHPLDEGGRHVDAARADRGGIAAAGLKVGGQGLDCTRIPVPGDEDHRPSFGVRRQGRLVMPPGAGSLVNGRVPYRGEVSPGQGQFDITLANGHDRIYAEVDFLPGRMSGSPV